MTPNYHDEIISGHNNFVFLHVHHIDTIKINKEVRTSLFHQFNTMGTYVRTKGTFFDFVERCHKLFRILYD